MMAVVRTCVSIVLLALLAAGFCATVRVCGAGDARAIEPAVVQDYGSPVAAVSGDASPDAASEPAPAVGGDVVRAAETGADEAGADEAGDTDSGGAERTGLELHNLAVWDSPDGSPHVYLSFTPISADSFLGDVPLRRAVVEGEEVEVADVAPSIDEEHVVIEVDGESAEVASLVWYYAGYGDLGGADTKYMPVCLIRVRRPTLTDGEHGLRVMIEDADSGAVGEANTTFMCGEGRARL